MGLGALPYTKLPEVSAFQTGKQAPFSANVTIREMDLMVLTLTLYELPAMVMVYCASNGVEPPWRFPLYDEP